MQGVNPTPYTLHPTPNIAIISGEVSGDVVGGALAQALLKRWPDLRLWGAGSTRMRGADVELLFDSSHWSAISIVESLKLVPKIRFQVFPTLLREIEARKPSVVILIDFGAVNIHIARWCKARGIRVFYYFPPGSWRRRGRVKEDIGRVTDCVVTPFPWSQIRLSEAGANAHFVGHPLLEIVKPSQSRSQFADRFGMDSGRPIIGLLPGSRAFEIEHNTPAMIGAAAIISRQIPDAQFVFGAVSSTSREKVQAAIKSAGEPSSGFTETTRELAQTVAKLDKERRRQTAPRLVTTEGVLVSLGDVDDLKKRAKSGNSRSSLPAFVIAEGLTYDVMAHSDTLIVCSGTATLEAAILETPMVIIYRVSRLMELEINVIRRIKPEHIGLPNIIANERIVPELIQQAATPDALATATLRFLLDPAYRAETKQRLQNMKTVLGTPGASDRTAELVLETAGLDIIQ